MLKPLFVRGNSIGLNCSREDFRLGLTALMDRVFGEVVGFVNCWRSLSGSLRLFWSWPVERMIFFMVLPS
jgi:hypothetical protein